MLTLSIIILMYISLKRAIVNNIYFIIINRKNTLQAKSNGTHIYMLYMYDYFCYNKLQNTNNFQCKPKYFKGYPDSKNQNYSYRVL